MAVYWTVCALTTFFVWVAMYLEPADTVIANSFMPEEKENTLSIHTVQRKGVIRPTLIVTSLLIFVTVCAIRYDVGQDYMYSYVPYFLDVAADRETVVDMESGYWLMNYLVSRVTDEYAYIFGICAVMFFVFSYLSIFRDSPYPALSVFLIIGTSYFFIFLNVMRQMVAISMTTFALRYVEEKKPYKFAAMVIAASTLHYSSLFFLPMYWLLRVRIKPRTAVISTAGVAIFTPVVSSVGRWIISKTVYAKYLGSIFDTGEQGFVIRLIPVVIMLFGCLLYKSKASDEKGKKDDIRYQIYFNMQLFAAYIGLLSGGIPLASRMRWMFGYSSVIMIPMVCGRIDNKIIRSVVKGAIVILYVGYIAITIGMRNGNNVLPYQTIFSR